MSASCQLEGCTVLQTGMCALENDIATCSNRVHEVAVPSTNISSIPLNDEEPDAFLFESPIGAAVLETPDEIPSFPPSVALGLHTVDEMMATRYGTIIGILGDPESGKTACLVSLYLLVSHAKLAGWSFADSRSLMAFEEIARGSRRWVDGQPPNQMTVHTELGDERQPGFLHLRLRRDKDLRNFDLFLPDLPGEWTKDLIKTEDCDRFEFMKSADVIWLMTDGRALIQREGRQGAIHRINLIIGRLAKLLDDRKPRIILVPTHRDHGEVPVATIDQIRKKIQKYGLSFEFAPVASFSNNQGQVLPGHGLSELIDATVRSDHKPVPFRRTTPVHINSRAFLSYRRPE